MPGYSKRFLFGEDDNEEEEPTRTNASYRRCLEHIWKDPEFISDPRGGLEDHTVFENLLQLGHPIISKYIPCGLSTSILYLDLFSLFHKYLFIIIRDRAQNFWQRIVEESLCAF